MQIASCVRWTGREDVKMKAMISQPMRGLGETIIKKERDRLTEWLKSSGYDVVNTLFDFESNNPLHYLAKSIEAMSEVDVVVFAPNWENARGCKIEYEIAKNYGKSIIIIGENNV